MNNIENIVLGTILSIKDYQDRILTSVNIDLFTGHNKIVFRTIEKLYRAGKNIDLLTVNGALTKDESTTIGGAYYLSMLTSEVGSGLHYEDYIKLLKDSYIRSRMIELYQTEINQLTDNLNDIEESYSRTINVLEKLFTISDSKLKRVYDLMVKRTNEIQDIKPNSLLGVNSGHSGINRITNGWQPADYIVLAARPSMGKTAISIFFIKFAALNNCKVLFFSLEMSSKRIIDRIISMDTDINTKELLSGSLEPDRWEKIDNNLIRYKNAEFYIDDEPGQTIEHITNKVLKELANGEIGMIVIDYIQLIKFSNKSGSTNEQVSHISGNIKTLAKKANCPVIALSQLSREVDKRSGDKRPQLADLRDSGSIEQDADIVIFIHRPEYYGIFEDGNGASLINQIDLIFRKNRNGPIGETSLYKNEDWSYIGEIPYNEHQSIINSEMPFNDEDYNLFNQLAP